MRALERGVESGSVTKSRKFVRLHIPSEIAEKTRPREVDYAVYWNRDMRVFEVAQRKRDGIYGLLSGELGIVRVRRAIGTYAAISDLVPAPFDPFVPEARDIPAEAKFRCHELYEYHIQDKVGGMEWAVFRSGTKESLYYRKHYLNPCRVLQMLGLIRFGSTSWRLA